jgi:hypothetical protein
MEIYIRTVSRFKEITVSHENVVVHMGLQDAEECEKAAAVFRRAANELSEIQHGEITE